MFCRARDGDGLCGFDRNRAEPARRQLACSAVARAAPARWALADRARRRRHRPDRRSERENRRTHAARAATSSMRTSAAFRSSSSVFSTSASASECARLLENNGDWLNTMTAMEFLRDVGKYFTVNYLLAKESVKRRIESEERHFLHRVQLFAACRPTTFSCCTIASHCRLQMRRQRSMGQHRRGHRL